MFVGAAARAAARTSTVARIPEGKNRLGGTPALPANQLSFASTFSTRAGSTTDMTVRAAASAAARAATVARTNRVEVKLASPAYQSSSALAFSTLTGSTTDMTVRAATSAAARAATVARTNRVVKLASPAYQSSSASAFSTRAGSTTDNTQDARKADLEFLMELKRNPLDPKVTLPELNHLNTQDVQKGAKLPEFSRGLVKNKTAILSELNKNPYLLYVLDAQYLKQIHPGTTFFEELICIVQSKRTSDIAKMSPAQKDDLRKSISTLQGGGLASALKGYI